MRGHTKSLDANDKLIQTRSHERDTIASRKRQVVMRKVKSTTVTNTRIVNPAVQPVGCVSHDLFCSCVWDFYSRGERILTWSHVVL